VTVNNSPNINNTNNHLSRQETHTHFKNRTHAHKLTVKWLITIYK